MAYIYLGGKTRRYLNTETGEEISRRQFDKLTKGVNYEKKAKANKIANLEEALARPARGRTKAVTTTEKKTRVESFQKKEEIKRTTRLEKLAAQKASKAKPKKIRPQLLKTGHYAERIKFTSWQEFEDLRRQMQSQIAPNGKRLITAYGIGIVGYDERTGQQLGATILPMRTPNTKLTENQLQDITDDFLENHTYFIFSYYFLHLRFNYEYAQNRLKKANKKNLPKRAK